MCRNEKNSGAIHEGDLPAGTSLNDHLDERERMSDSAVNVLYVLGHYLNGDGCTEASRLLGILGLPNDTTMDRRSFGIIEDKIGPEIRALGKEIVRENLIEEVRVTMEREGKPKEHFERWKDSIDPQKATKTLSLEHYAQVDASFDAAW